MDATAPGAAADNKVLTVKFAPETVYEDCHAIWNKEISFTDGTIEIDSKAVASDGYFGGMAFRIQDKDNYYAIRCGIRRSDIQLFKISNGTRTTIGYATATAFSVNTWYHIKIVVNATNFTVLVDGTQLLTKTDDSITGSGGVGLFQRANKIAFWDNFSVSY
jgi:archaellum component FlaF (FlaF/FlaG flagellin family)